MVGIADLDAVTSQRETFRHLGYERHETGMPGRPIQEMTNRARELCGLQPTPLREE